MVVVVVAGGLGDLGRLIVKELIALGTHEVYALSRKAHETSSEGSSPTAPSGPKIVTTDYSDSSLQAIFREIHAHTVISAVNLDWEAASLAQVQLIKSAAASGIVKRFIPSEFNIDYDLEDDILPYADKKYHTVARRELEKTELEYTYIYCGMFMDYFGLPYFPTDMRALYTIFDLQHHKAVISGDGTALMAVTYTTDVARLVARSLSVNKWPRAFSIAGAVINSNDLVDIAQRIMGNSLEVERDSLEDLYAKRAILLPSNLEAAKNFPGGADQLKALIADLSVPLALGAYNVGNAAGAVDLVKTLGADAGPMLGLEEFFRITLKEKQKREAAVKQD